MIDGDSVRSDRRIATEIVPSTFIDNETMPAGNRKGQQPRTGLELLFHTEDEI